MSRPTSHAEQQSVVRTQVQQMLGQSRSFHQLPPGERSRILAHTTAIVEAMAQNAPKAVPDPYALAMDTPPPVGGSTTQTTSNTPTRTDFGRGVQTAVQQTGQLLREVDFPGFVSSLISGVFKSIVQSSIDQMRAYGELVQSVAMSLNDFRDQNVTDGQAQEHLASKYPSLFQVSVNNGESNLNLKDGADSGELPNFKQDLGLDEDVTDLDDETIKEKLVPAARTSLAKSRQKLLATMVLMGINRIIVTDGKINAKLRFTFNTNDSMTSNETATTYQNAGNTTNSRGGVFSRDAFNLSVPNIKVADVTNTVGQADLTTQGQMMGEVSVNFKSETFPLEKMVNTDQMTRLESASAGRAVPAGQAAAPAAAPAPAPAAPAPAPAPATR